METVANFLFQVPGVFRGGKEFLPDPHRFLIEIGALQNGNAQFKKGIEKERRKSQLIGLIIEPVSGPQIFGERPDFTESFGPVLGGRPDDIGDFLICRR